jgi:hypothetical protein
MDPVAAGNSRRIPENSRDSAKVDLARSSKSGFRLQSQGPKEEDTMRYVASILVGTALFCALGTEAVQACGNKFALVGRAASFRHVYAAVHPASIVLFAEPQFGASAKFREKSFQKDLTLAGHTVLVASAESEFQTLLRTQKVDLVLVDRADAQRVAKIAATTKNNPAVMEVITKEEAKQQQGEKKKCLKTTDRAESFLDDIDQVMKTRADQARGKS